VPSPCLSNQKESCELSSSVLGVNHLSWLELLLLKAVEAGLENIALSSGAESSQPMFWQPGWARSNLEKVINASVEVRGWEHLKALHLLITGCKSRHTAVQPMLFTLYLLVILLANSLFCCDIRQR